MFNTSFEPEKVFVKSYAVAEYKTFLWFYPPHRVIMLCEFKIEQYLLKSFMTLGVMEGFIFLP